MACQPFDDRLRLVGERVGPRRVQGHGGIDARIPVGGLGGPPRRVEVVGDGDDGLHADGGGAVDDRAHIVGALGPARVEVGVRVDQRGQRLRRRWRRPAERLLLTRTP